MYESSLEGREAAGECLVMKFGGTSVQDAAAIRRVCQLVRRASSQHPVLVVSALAKVTDQLMDAGWAAAEESLRSASAILQPVRQRHETVAAGLVAGDEYVRLREKFARDFEVLEKVLSTIAWEKAFAPHAQDQLLGLGETLSSRLVQRLCGQRGSTRSWWMRRSASSLMPHIRVRLRCGRRPTNACNQGWLRC